MKLNRSFVHFTLLSIFSGICFIVAGIKEGHWWVVLIGVYLLVLPVLIKFIENRTKKKKLKRRRNELQDRDNNSGICGYSGCC